MIIIRVLAALLSHVCARIDVNLKMAGDDAVDEAMQIEILPSTSNGDAKIKEKDNKSQSLPWYVLSLQKKLYSSNRFILL